jgi:hypothetical protein
MLCSIATKVNEATVAEITALEKETGKTLLAFQCHQLAASQLDEQTLSKIQAAEQKLGISLVAVDA